MSDKPNIIIFDAAFMLSEYLVKNWIQMAEAYIQQTGRFSCALSGGQTPREFYSKLAAKVNPALWSKVHIFFTDERFVEDYDKDNNYRLLKDLLLNHIQIPATNIHPIPTQVETVGMAAEEYKNRLVNFFTLDQNNLPIIDFVLLGIGEDGHTASLFPDTEGMNDPRRLTLPVSKNHLKHERISITLPVINNAKQVYFIVTGQRKCAIVKDIIEDHKIYPASLVRPTNGEMTLLMDAEAASLLKDQQKYMFREAGTLN